MENLIKGFIWFLVVLLPGGLLIALIGSGVRYLLNKYHVKRERVEFIVLLGMLVMSTVTVVILYLIIN